MSSKTLNISIDLNRSKEFDRKAKAAVLSGEALKPRYPIFRRLNDARLVTENLIHAGTAGVSAENQDSGFRPAFRDRQTGRVEPARFRDGSPAPMHLLEGLPEEWVVDRDDSGRVSAIKASVIAGFLRKGRFYTREEAANAVRH